MNQLGMYNVTLLAQGDLRHDTLLDIGSRLDAAREHVVGTVTLIAVFTGSGDVKNIEVFYGLPAGLTENAIAVARMITFTPAMKDGHPVSQKM